MVWLFLDSKRSSYETIPTSDVEIGNFEREQQTSRPGFLNTKTIGVLLVTLSSLLIVSHLAPTKGLNGDQLVHPELLGSSRDRYSHNAKEDKGGLQEEEHHVKHHDKHPKEHEIDCEEDKNDCEEYEDNEEMNESDKEHQKNRLGWDTKHKVGTEEKRQTKGDLQDHHKGQGTYIVKHESQDDNGWENYDRDYYHDNSNKNDKDGNNGEHYHYYYYYNDKTNKNDEDHGDGKRYYYHYYHDDKNHKKDKDDNNAEHYYYRYYFNDNNDKNNTNDEDGEHYYYYYYNDEKHKDNNDVERSYYRYYYYDKNNKNGKERHEKYIEEEPVEPHQDHEENHAKHIPESVNHGSLQYKTKIVKHAESAHQPLTTVQLPTPTTVKVPIDQPANLEDLTPPGNLEKSTLPANLEESTLPANLEESTPPANLEESATPANLEESTPPANLEESTPPANVESSAIERFAEPVNPQHPSGEQKNQPQGAISAPKVRSWTSIMNFFKNLKFGSIDEILHK